jgi:uncharacterized protein (TIGR02594 family)
VISRRSMNAGLMAASVSVFNPIAGAQSEPEELPFTQLNYPPFDALDAPQKFGLNEPTQAQKAKVSQIIQSTPRGPRPYDVARSFVDRFYGKDPEVISQWPRPAAWNPLIVEFFSATTKKANNDMIPWCAAFANWCLIRSNRVGSNSAASQSFLASRAFKKTDEPKVGDLAIFTCFDQKSGKSLGLGHATFVRELPANGKLKVTGGNQSTDGHSSIICDSEYPLGDRIVKRHVGGNYVPTVMRLSKYISIV